MSAGPYETEREAYEHPAVQAIRENVQPGDGRLLAAKVGVIRAVLDRAGVATGTYDRRIICFAADIGGPEAAVSLAGLIERAADGPWRRWLLGTDFSTEARCPECGNDVMITDDCVYPAGSGEGEGLGRPAELGDLVDAIRRHKCPAGGDTDG